MLTNNNRTSVYIKILGLLLAITFLLQNLMVPASGVLQDSKPIGDSDGNSKQQVVTDGSEQTDVPKIELRARGLGGCAANLAMPMAAPISKNDITVDLKILQTEYATYSATASDGGAPPPQLGVAVSAEVIETGTEDDDINQIIIEIDQQKGYLDKVFFKDVILDDINGNDQVFESAEITEQDGKQYVVITLKKGIDNGLSEYRFYLDFDMDYDRGVADKTRLVNFSFEIVSCGETIVEKDGFYIDSEAELDRRFNNMTNSTPPLKAVSGTDSKVFEAELAPKAIAKLSDQRILNNYFYKNDFDEGNPPEFNIYFPVGTELEEADIVFSPKVHKFQKGTNGKGISVADGEVPGVPAGTYYVLHVPVNPKTDQCSSTRASWVLRIAGANHRCEIYYGLGFYLPEIPVGEVQEVFYNFSYTTLGSDEREYFTNTTRYKAIEKEDWNFQFNASHNTGVSGVNATPISGIGTDNNLEVNRILAAIRAAGFGFTHPASQKNLGYRAIENTEFVLYQKTASESSAKANFVPFITRSGGVIKPTGMELRVSRESNRFAWNKYQYYFEIKDAITGDTRQQAGKNGSKQTEMLYPTSAAATDVLYMHGFEESTLGEHEYVDSLVIIPYGKVDTPETDEYKGLYEAKNSFHVAYMVGSWSRGYYPDGTPTHSFQEVRVIMGWYIRYLDESNPDKPVMTKREGANVPIRYTSKSQSPRGQFVSNDPDINNKKPGDTVQYQFTGYNQSDAKSPWEAPVIRVILPHGTKIEDLNSVVATYNGLQYKVTVKPIGEISDTQDNVYEFSGMNRLSVARRNNFTIDFSIVLPSGIPEGSYDLRAVLYSRDIDFYILAERDGVLPSGEKPEDYGLTADDSFRHFKDSTYSNIPFKVSNLERVVYRSIIKSAVTGDKGSEESTVAAPFGSVVEVIMQIENQGNVNYTGFSLFDILPREGYLKSTGSLAIEKIVHPEEGKLYYYIGDTVFNHVNELPIPLTEIDPTKWSTDENDRNQATAFYVDFENFILKGGEKIEISIHFRLPEKGEGINDQEVFNQYAFTRNLVGEPNQEPFYSRVQGFSTKNYQIQYKPNPGTEEEMKDQLPVIDSGVFLKKETNYLIVKDLPTRDHHVATGWSTDPEATEPEDDYKPGTKISFVEKRPILTLYPTWEAMPPTFAVPERISFGEKQIGSLDMTIPWIKVDGKDDDTVGVTINNYSDIDCEIYASASYFEHETSSYKLNDTLSYKASSQTPLIELYDDTPTLIHSSTAESGTIFYCWKNGNDKIGLNMDLTGILVQKGNYHADITWQLRYAPDPNG